MPDSPRLIRVLLHPASQGRSSQDRHGLCPGGAHGPVSTPSKAIFTLESQAACSLVPFWKPFRPCYFPYFAGAIPPQGESLGQGAGAAEEVRLPPGHPQPALAHHAVHPTHVLPREEQDWKVGSGTGNQGPRFELEFRPLTQRCLEVCLG